MKIKKLLFILLFVFPALAATKQVAPSLHSAHRDINEPAGKAYQRYIQRLRASGYKGFTQDTAIALAKPLEQLEFTTVAEYSSAQAALEVMQKVRDVRFLQDTKHNMLRRASWLYPDDGCFARAALAVQNIKLWNLPVPSKVFIFGNLSVDTPNSPEGSVGWWYHVVPLVRVQGKPVVIDPAINPHQPLSLQDWVLTMTADIQSVRLAVCDSTSYSPSSPCKVSSDSSSSATADQMRFLSEEWYRLERLKRDPKKELGDSPPWQSVW